MKAKPSSPPLALGGRAATPIAFIRAIVLAYHRYGANPASALAKSGITADMLDNPDARVTAAQMEIISGTAMQELDDEALGWFSRRLPWGSYGMLCRASLGSPNLGVALKRWCRHHRLLTDDITLALEVTKTAATLRITPHRPLGEMHEFCLVTLLRYVLGYACWAIDSRIPLREAHFPFAAPPHADAYPLMFTGTLHYEAAAARYSFDEQYLALPLQRDERALRTMLKRALPLTVLQYRRDRLLGQRVRELLHAHPGSAHTAEALAALLHLSSRTLHRQLHEEGLSLQALKDEVRQAQAMDQLRRSQRPIKQVALAVGFRNEKSFARAFRAWTGVTPGEFRRTGR